jgi:hypothetical protein
MRQVTPLPGATTRTPLLPVSYANKPCLAGCTKYTVVPFLFRCFLEKRNSIVELLGVHLSFVCGVFLKPSVCHVVTFANSFPHNPFFARILWLLRASSSEVWDLPKSTSFSVHAQHGCSGDSFCCRCS